MEDNTLDFNFWPSFSDLMLTLVLILVIVVFAVIAAFSVGTEEPAPEPPDGTVIPPEVKEKQMKIINAIAAAYGVESIVSETDSHEIRIQLNNNRYTKITIKNEPTLQRYSFSDRVLFEPNEFYLNQNGKDTLRTVGLQIKRNINFIREIQIQGHADPTPPDFEPSNLHLAAKRAISVFRFLQYKIHINPARHLMSATSFGEYKPVQRSDSDRTYSPEKLKQHNRRRDLRDKNRRMDILLFYRDEHQEKQKEN